MDFSSMSGWDFERYCADCLLKKGFTKAEVTSGSGDHGVDIIAEQNGIRFGIQCKLYQGQIPNKAVQEAYTGASYYDCDVAVIMSNSELTKQAQTEAKKLRVKFWNIADYMPEDSKVCEISANSNNVVPQDYNEYIQQKKMLENEVRQEVESKIKSKQETALNDKVVPDLKACQNEEFVDSLAWLTPQSLRYDTWYPFIQSIELYLQHLEDIGKDTTDDALLLKKLSYIRWLYTCLNVVGDGLLRTLWDNASDAVRFLQTNAIGATSKKSETINTLYWNVRYLFNQEQVLFEELEKIIKGFSIEERMRIKTISDSEELCGLENEIYENRKCLSNLENWWKILPEKEEQVRMDISFMRNDSKIEEIIQKNQRTVQLVYEQFVNYEEYRNLQMQKIYEEKAKNILKKKERKNSQSKEKQEKERILKEKEERETLFEKQQEEERLLKQQQEKELLIQSIVTVYNDGCKKINAEMSSRKKELENKAQVAISQAQQQIADLLKKKQSFTFFRKERDAKIDATIATIERYVEQVKANLASDTEECEQEAQRKIKGLKEYALHRAEQIGATEDLEKMIRCNYYYYHNL